MRVSVVRIRVEDLAAKKLTEFFAHHSTIVEHIPYFRSHLEQDPGLQSEDEDLEFRTLDVKCNIPIFAWIISWAGQQSGDQLALSSVEEARVPELSTKVNPPAADPPGLGAHGFPDDPLAFIEPRLDKCLPILIAAHFLGITRLVDASLRVLLRHLPKVAFLGLDLTGLSMEILTKIALLVDERQLEATWAMASSRERLAMTLITNERKGGKAMVHGERVDRPASSVPVFKNASPPSTASTASTACATSSEEYVKIPQTGLNNPVLASTHVPLSTGGGYGRETLESHAKPARVLVNLLYKIRTHQRFIHAKPGSKFCLTQCVECGSLFPLAFSSLLTCPAASGKVVVGLRGGSLVKHTVSIILLLVNLC